MNKTKNIELFSFYDGEFTALKDIFLSSVRDDFKVKCLKLDLSREARTEKWGEACALKIVKIIEEIKNNMGRLLIYSDIDIVFLKPIKKIVLKSIIDNDIVFQAETKPFLKFLKQKANINSGFMAIQCSPKTLKFFEHVLDINMKDKKLIDQDIVTDLLSKDGSGIMWDIFPGKISARSHTPDIIKPFMAVFHANCTLIPEEKIKMLKKILDYNNLSIFGKIKFYTLKELRKKTKRILSLINNKSGIN